MESESWPAEWLRGVLGVCVLRVLLDGPTYGYAISTRLESAGLGPLKGGTLYPLLNRLEQAGWVGVEWRPGEGGPGRKYFALTESGRREAHAQVRRWARFAQITTTLTSADGTANVLGEPVRAQEG
ncbi:PadR family transcriptional regulator [Micromonospora sp. WMMD1082]|uniref:PadR family transcriptional regulator n=1 Tax=Micromonospora sp. WMMD1082 TaxID=3016104 RepID=UPI002415A8F2|nr:PadR family transcriptional regulator [Micromonospora sp. WMMD1082]MDG4797413.1 PadR family transcriptional regulator [Micromonospora sp. WMMD1082]